MVIKKEEYESDDESNYEEFLDEYAVYYSDFMEASSNEESLDYNPWTDAYSPDYICNSDDEIEEFFFEE